MKNAFYLSLLFVLTSLFSCRQGKKERAKYIDSATRYPGNPRPDKQGFVALFEKDSASLNLINDQNGEVTGQLYINYHKAEPLAFESELNIGKIDGFAILLKISSLLTIQS